MGSWLLYEDLHGVMASGSEIQDLREWQGDRVHIHAARNGVPELDWCNAYIAQPYEICFYHVTF